MAESFTLIEHFNATPERIYRSWIDADSHAAMTGAGAKSEPRVLGFYSAWDEYATGTYLELEANKKIVMTWRTTDFEPEAPDSKLTIQLAKDSAGTLLTLIHENVPDGTTAEYRDGWRDYYFVPMQEYFSTHK